MAAVELPPPSRLLVLIAAAGYWAHAIRRYRALVRGGATDQRSRELLQMERRRFQILGIATILGLGFVFSLLSPGQALIRWLLLTGLALCAGFAIFVGYKRAELESGHRIEDSSKLDTINSHDLASPHRGDSA